jgi:drug/metabolite transporter (DMT)-like permease
MSASSSQQNTGHARAATPAKIVLAFACVYFFWGSTYTAIRIGATEMPALLLAGTRFLIAGAILLAWCRWRGLRIVYPTRTMLVIGLVGLLLLGGGNVGLVFAERVVPSGLASLAYAVTPLYIALIEYVLPGGEPLPARGWLGLLLGFAGLAVMIAPSLQASLHGNPALFWALASLFAGTLCWAAGSLASRHARLPVDTLVAASWQMLIAGAADTLLGTALGEWPGFHPHAAGLGAIAYLVTGGSLIGYTAFIYLLDHLPVAKVMSYTYVNPVVAVLMGIALLGERPNRSEFAGMAAIVLAVFLLTTAQIKAKARPAMQSEP